MHASRRTGIVQGRNSDSHPITISWIAGPEDSQVIAGRLGLCYCPGKKVGVQDNDHLQHDAHQLWVVQVVRSGVTHDRDLSKDLHTLREVHGVTTIVCLLNDAELRVRPTMPECRSR